MDGFLSTQKRCLKLLFCRSFKLLIKCGLHRLRPPLWSDHTKYVWRKPEI